MSAPVADTLILPIQQQLCAVAEQIDGIDPALCFPTPPTGALEEGSVLFPLKNWAIDSSTNGKLRVKLTFTALQIFAMRPLDEVIPDIQAFIVPWWMVLSAWANQSLGGKAISLDFSEGDIRQVTQNSTSYYALAHTLEVLVQVNVRTAS